MINIPDAFHDLGKYLYAIEAKGKYRKKSLVTK